MSIVEIDKVAGKRPKLAYNWPGPFSDYDQIGKGRAAVNRGESPPGASGIPSEEKGYKGWVTLPLWESGRHTRLRLRVRPIDEDSDSG